MSLRNQQLIRPKPDTALYRLIEKHHPYMAVKGKYLHPVDAEFLETIGINRREWSYIIRGQTDCSLETGLKILEHIGAIDTKLDSENE